LDEYAAPVIVFWTGQSKNSDIFILCKTCVKFHISALLIVVKVVLTVLTQDSLQYAIAARIETLEVTAYSDPVFGRGIEIFKDNFLSAKITCEM
jgi:hypothetical protein